MKHILAKQYLLYFIILGLFIFSGFFSHAQQGMLRPGGTRQLSNIAKGNTGGGDTLARRDKFADSITLRFRYIDSTRNYSMDSSIVDFYKRYSIPVTHLYLGNHGSATQSLLFKPNQRVGWDAGLHALDVYKWDIQKARYFSTTRPYTELNYMLGSRSEQMIELIHTQNISSNWNFMLGYRLINAPGMFKNQKSNHNNYQLTSRYESNNKRYNLYFATVANNLQVGENGGIQDSVDFLNDDRYKDRFNIATMLGGDGAASRNFFSTDVGTGNRYSELAVNIRQQYDFGRKDSFVTDSTIIPLFYPRLRFQHNLQYGSYTYLFKDLVADSAYYASRYAIDLQGSDSFQLRDKWQQITNDFSIYQFPDANNLHQFVKVGAGIENLMLRNEKGRRNFYNVYGHAEYRNLSKNKRWDMQLNGKFYFVGLNNADYAANARLQRFLGKDKGYVILGAENVNRTPSFIYDNRSAFYLAQNTNNFKKENITHLNASLYLNSLKMALSGDYYLVTNYTYYTNFFEPAQQTALFNMLRIGANKTINVWNGWKWHSDIYLQQRIGNAPVNVPLIFTRNRFGYEGNLGFKNLDIAFGIDTRYMLGYEADNYSPLLGQFFYQDSVKINYKLPDIAAYVHFRIKSFKFYARAENLNTARIHNGAFGFTNNNLAAPNYPYPGFLMRFGVFWGFVN